MASAEERGGAAPAPSPAASPPPYEETYDEYLARQYAQNNMYSTGTGVDPTYAWGQAGVNNAAPPPPESTLPTQQETLDYYGSQSINDYGPPPQPAYVATDVGQGASPPPPPPTGGMWDLFSAPQRLANRGLDETVPKVVNAKAVVDDAFAPKAPPVAMAPGNVPGISGSVPRPPGWVPATVEPVMLPLRMINTGMNPTDNMTNNGERYDIMVPYYIDGFSPVERAWNVFGGDYRQYRDYWNQREYGPGPQWQVNKEGRRHDRRIEKRNDRRNS